LWSTLSPFTFLATRFRRTFGKRILIRISAQGNVVGVVQDRRTSRRLLTPTPSFGPPERLWNDFSLVFLLHAAPCFPYDGCNLG
jgi:hypothetical protein